MSALNSFVVGDKNLCMLINEVNPDLVPDSSEDGNEHNNNSNSPADNLTDFGEMKLPSAPNNIHVITVIGQVEGHLIMSPQNKTTKYEHIIPQLVAVEQSSDIKGLLVILNTVGGDVEAGLAMAEMISTMTKPTVSLVLGGGHSIGVPIAVAATRSFIAPTATMTIHPIRLTGLVVGVQQSFDYLERMQDRVLKFITAHSGISTEKLRALMMTTGELARDIGTVVVGKDAVEYGLISEVGGLDKALESLRQMIKQKENEQAKTEKAKKPAKDKASKAVKK